MAPSIVRIFLIRYICAKLGYLTTIYVFYQQYTISIQTHLLIGFVFINNIDRNIYLPDPIIHPKTVDHSTSADHHSLVFGCVCRWVTADGNIINPLDRPCDLSRAHFNAELIWTRNGDKTSIIPVNVQYANIKQVYLAVFKCQTNPIKLN